MHRLLHPLGNHNLIRRHPLKPTRIIRNHRTRLGILLILHLLQMLPITRRRIRSCRKQRSHPRLDLRPRWSPLLQFHNVGAHAFTASLAAAEAAVVDGVAAAGSHVAVVVVARGAVVADSVATQAEASVEVFSEGAEGH